VPLFPLSKSCFYMRAYTRVKWKGTAYRLNYAKLLSSSSWKGCQRAEAPPGLISGRSRSHRVSRDRSLNTEPYEVP
jgi:hypothetical protein